MSGPNQKEIDSRDLAMHQVKTFTNPIILTIILPAIGFALVRLWIMCVDEQGVVFSNEYTGYLFSLIGRGAFPLLVVLVLNAKPLSRRVQMITIPLAVIIMSVSGVLILTINQAEAYWLYVVASFSGSSCAGWLYVCWAEAYRYVKIRDVAISILISLVLSAVISFLLTLVFAWVTLTAVAVLPFLAGILYMSLEKPLFAHEVSNKATFTGYYDGEMTSLFGKWFGLLSLYSMVIGAIHVISNSETNIHSHSSLYAVYIGSAITISLIIIIGLVATNRIFSLDLFWLIIIPIIAASLLLSAIRPEMLQIVFSVFAAIRYIVFGFINMKLIDIAHHSRKPLYVMFAGGWGLSMLSMTFGMLLMLYFYSNYAISINIVVIGILAVLGMASVLLLNNSSMSDVYVGSDKVTNLDADVAYDVEAALLRDCQKLQTDYGLTERETQVVLLIAQGHTQAYCADALVVSINTIRGHMKRIYLKLDIHSKEELLQALSESSKAVEVEQSL